MDIKPFLKIGSRVIVTCPEREDPETVFVSRMEDLQPDAIAIAVPLRRGRRLPLRTGELVRLQVLVDDAILEFESTVIELSASVVQLFLISYPDTGGRIQRRWDVRLKVMLRVRGCLETAAGPEEIVFHTFDISAGGVSLHSPCMLEAGTELWLYFRIQQRTGVRYIQVRGKVVRVTPPDEPDENTFRLGVQFTQIKKADKDFIVGFIFEHIWAENPGPARPGGFEEVRG